MLTCNSGGGKLVTKMLQNGRKNVGNGNFSGFDYYLKVYGRKPWDFILKKPCIVEFALIC